jgi:hypothetical protein
VGRWQAQLTRPTRDGRPIRIIIENKRVSVFYYRVLSLSDRANEYCYLLRFVQQDLEANILVDHDQSESYFG